MDIGGSDVDSLGSRPITSKTARDVLSNPRWAYLLFELDILNNQKGPQSLDDLADRLELSPEAVDDIIDELEDRDAVHITSESPPRYRSRGCRFFAKNWVELPDGKRVKMIPKAMFGAVGYGHLDPTVQQFIDEYGYEKYHTVTTTYPQAVLDDDSEFTLEEMFPEIPDSDLSNIKRGPEYAHNRLSEDPLWDDQQF